MQCFALLVLTELTFLVVTAASAKPLVLLATRSARRTQDRVAGLRSDTGSCGRQRCRCGSSATCFAAADTSAQAPPSEGCGPTGLP